MHAYDHKPQQARSPAPANGGEHERNAEDTALREFPLDLAAVRERLGKSSGKEYWRSLEELAGDPHFEELLHPEFPRYASELDEAVDRPEVLKLIAASPALAGLSRFVPKP